MVFWPLIFEIWCIWTKKRGANAFSVPALYGCLDWTPFSCLNLMLLSMQRDVTVLLCFMLNIICVCTFAEMTDNAHHVWSCIRRWSGSTFSLPGCIFRSSHTARDRQKTNCTSDPHLRGRGRTRTKGSINHTAAIEDSGWRSSKSWEQFTLPIRLRGRIFRKKKLYPSLLHRVPRDYPGRAEFLNASCSSVPLGLHPIHRRGTIYMGWLYICTSKINMYESKWDHSAARPREKLNDCVCRNSTG